MRDAEQFASKYEQSISQTAENFRKLITKLYSIDCDVLKRNFETKTYDSKWHLKSFDISEFSELLKFGRPVFTKIDSIYYLIFPFCNDRQTFSINHYLIIHSARPIKRFILTNLVKATNYYFNSYLSKIRLEHISDLQNKIIQIHTEREIFIKGINVEEKLKRFCELSFQQLLSTTGVFSATVRLFDPFKQELKLVHSEPKTDNLSLRVITSKNRKDSINFLTFDYCKKNHFLYCKDVPKFKGNKRKLNIDRDTTLTELCFPLFFKDIKIGTVNFESPLQQAFGKILNLYNHKYYFKIDNKIASDALFHYFFTVKNLIQEFIEILFESNDKGM